MLTDDYTLARYLVRQIVERGLNLAESHDEWMRCAFALATLGEAGRELFHDVARQSAKYDFRTNEREFNSALRTRGRHVRPVGFGSFVMRCRDAGIELPRRSPSTPIPNPQTPQPMSHPTPPPAPAAQPAQAQPCHFLLSLGRWLTPEQYARAVALYRLEARPDGGIIFWQIEPGGRCRDGKVMYYLPDGHRDRSPSRHPTWMSTRLSAAEREALRARPQVLFGQHLLPDRPGAPVALVEAEKTAVLCSQLLEAEGYLWLATGGESALRPEAFEAMRGRPVILFPDTDPEGHSFARWSRIAREASERYAMQIHVSSLLEVHATAAQKERKIDIADLLIDPEP